MRKLRLREGKPQAPGQRPDFKDHAPNTRKREKGMRKDAEKRAWNLHIMIWVCLLRESSWACQSPKSNAFRDQAVDVSEGCGLGAGRGGHKPSQLWPRGKVGPGLPNLVSKEKPEIWIFM